MEGRRLQSLDPQPSEVPLAYRHAASTRPFYQALLELADKHERELSLLRQDFEAAAEKNPEPEPPEKAPDPPCGELAPSATFAAFAEDGNFKRRTSDESDAPRPPGGSWSSTVMLKEHSEALQKSHGRRNRWVNASVYGGSRNRLTESSRGWSTSEVSQLGTSRVQIRSGHAVVPACNVLINAPGFDAACSFMIMGNAMLMGVTADWRVRNPHESEVPMGLLFCDRLFTSWFLLELLMRLCGQGLDFFSDPGIWHWNVFDLLVVGADVANMAVSLSSPDDMGTGEALPVVRLLRVLRFTRALFIVRMFRFFRELRVMVLSVLRSGRALLWSMMLFLLNLFLFSVFFTGQVASHRAVADGPADGPELRELVLRFGSMASAIDTLFMSVSGGLNWADASAALRHVHWSNSALFTFFVFFTLFALVNIITGIFVDTAIQSAQSDRDEVVQAQLTSRHSTLQQMQEIFEAADIDKDGMMSLQELEELLRNKRVRAHMAALELQLEEARELFRLIDTTNSGAVDIEEFIFGCMRLKGSARSIDVATLKYENKKLFNMLIAFFDYVEDQFAKVNKLTACKGGGLAERGRQASEALSAGPCCEEGPEVPPPSSGAFLGR